jgi:class 3 adenylate cyclase/tetratricopeptide (TPR) repeat protein
MKCPACQHEIPAGARFCGQCSAPVAAVCPACGASSLPESRFCGQCGTPLAKALPPRFDSPEDYTPRHLAEKILTSRSALEGERKQVTVLFADLKGSMELLADRDPEEARRVLDPVLELMIEAVHRYEGTVNQVMGDGIMALFGAPLAQEAHAIRACYAALSMQEAVKRHSDEVRSARGLDVQIRVGLNSGEVVVRSVGSDLRMDYTAVGQTTHLAARLEQMATPGTILITADTLRLAEGFVQTQMLGATSVKGLAAQIEVFELTGASPARSRLQAAAARGLTRFVGRDAELETLRWALERTQGGHGQIVTVVGEPGVGKSRLFWEFLRSPWTQGLLVLESSSAAYGKVTPYLPVIDLVKGYFQIEPQDDGSKIREKVTGKLLTLDEALRPTLPALLALLNVPVEDPPWQALDPRQRRERTLEAVRHLLLREGQIQPLLLVFEDLHWIDSETQAFLDSLVESLPSARILLLVNYRLGYQHGWGSKTYYTQLGIEPLPPESANDLLHALVGDDPALQPLKQLLIARTQGNPFFLEETVRTLRETQVLAGERGAYRLARPLETVRVPATVQAVLAARIDRLPPEEKRLLQSAAVIGETLPFTLLQAVVEMPEEELRRSLGHLQAAEFLYETSLFPESEYAFKHGLTCQVAYESLLQGLRRARHAQLVTVIERLYADRLPEQVERLAHHAFAGEVWEKAVIYLRQAGSKAAARSANREAVAHFEHGVDALRHLPETPQRMEQAIDLRFDLRNALLPLGEFGRILEYLREAEDLATRLGDQPRLGWVCCYLTDYFRQMGNHELAIDAGRRSLTIVEAHEDFALRVATNIYLGHVYYDMGRYRQGAESFRRNVELLGGDLVRERFGLPYVASVHSRTWLAFCLAELGGFGEGIRRAEEAVRIAEAVEHPSSLASAYTGLGRVYLRKGDLQAAIPPLERGLELVRAWNIRLLFPQLAEGLGSAYALSGRLAEAQPLLEQALEQHASMRRTAAQSIRVASLAQAYLLAGRADEALRLAERALALARSHGEQGNLAHALRLLGDITSSLDPPAFERSETYFGQAIALAEELEMRPLVARCHLGLGKLYAQAVRPEQARHPLTTAAALFREMDMSRWLEQSEAGLRALP